jgi:hypothetical protein
MADLRTAAQQALEALEEATNYTGCETWSPSMTDECLAVAAALKAALEQPEQEPEPVTLPCCGYTDASAIKWNRFNGVVQCHNCGQTYTHPPRGEWQSLSLEAVAKALADAGLQPEDYREDGQILPLVRAIEAALKERNT